MNQFGFDVNEAIKGLIQIFFVGLSFGFIIGFIRFIYLSIFERKE